MTSAKDSLTTVLDLAKTLRDQRDKDIAELYGQGLSLRQIAQLYGLSSEGVRRILIAAGVTRRDRLEATRLHYDRKAGA